MTEGAFFQDLALLMAVAGLASVVCSRLKWPKALGYILAGVLMSRHTWGGSFLADESSVQTIGQLGVVFLMFAMGLDFSPSQMKKLGRVTFPTAIWDTFVMVWLGYTVGRNCFGWGVAPSLFLGAAICDSATTLLAKIIGEMRWEDRPFVKYVLGTSVCEDIVTVVILAVITGFATGQGVSVGAVSLSLGGLLMFFLGTLVFGFVLIPRLLKSIAKFGDDETLILTVLGCCFFVSYIAYIFNFSLALGAFLVGVIGASSDVHHRLVRFVEPLKAMFAAVFFVSIGLLVDPVQCCANLPYVLVISLVVVVGKLLNCTLAALFTGQELKSAVQMGFGLAQIGEFAFLVAMLYVSLTGDAATPMYQIVVAVSIVTTLLNPLMIRLSDPVGDWLERVCPKKIAAGLEGYRALLARLRDNAGVSPEMKAVRFGLVYLGVIGVLNFVVAFACSMLNAHDWRTLSTFFEAHKTFFFSLAFNIFMVGMLASVVRAARRTGDALAAVLTGLGDAPWQLALRPVVRLFTLVMAIALWFLQLTMINVNLHPEEPLAQWVMLALMVAAGVFGWRFFLKNARVAEVRLRDAMTADERRRKDLPANPLTLTVPAERVHQLTIPEASPAIGLSIAQLNIRAKTGATIIRVTRDGRLHRNTGPDWVFRAADIVVAYGEGAQIAALKDLLGVTA